MFPNTKTRYSVVLVFLALLVVPAPLLPPDRLAEAVESTLGISWMAAYFVAGAGLQICFYGLVGMLATFAVIRAPTLRGRLLQQLMPLVVTVWGHSPLGEDVIFRLVECRHPVALPCWRGLDSALYKVGRVTVFITAY